MNILAKVTFGSFLYGVNVETSDRDTREIYLPDIKDCLLLKVRESKENKEEDDSTTFALQFFLNMAAQGQSVAIELLSAPKDKVISTSPIWDYLQENRKRFYTKNMKSFLRYSKAMAQKYSSRVDRLSETSKVIKYLEVHDGFLRLGSEHIWNDLPESTNALKSINPRNNNVDNRVYEVASKKLQATIRMEYAIEIIEKLVHSYGQRVQAANAMGGSDWKAISHSFRVGYQLYHIYKNDGFIYPLPESEFLKDVKYGKLNYIDDKIDQKLNDLITEVEQLSIASNYPNKVDQEWIKSIILEAYGFKPLEWRS